MTTSSPLRSHRPRCGFLCAFGPCSTPFLCQAARCSHIGQESPSRQPKRLSQHCARLATSRRVLGRNRSHAQSSPSPGLSGAPEPWCRGRLKASARSRRAPTSAYADSIVHLTPRWQDQCGVRRKPSRIALPDSVRLLVGRKREPGPRPPVTGDSARRLNSPDRPESLALASMAGPVVAPFGFPDRAAANPLGPRAGVPPVVGRTPSPLVRPIRSLRSGPLGATCATCDQRAQTVLET